MNEELIKAHTEALSIHSKALAAHCECLGMNAENAIACNLNLGIPYSNDDYVNVLKSYGLIEDSPKSVVEAYFKANPLPTKSPKKDSQNAR